jgi:hypothetical protein
MRRLGLRPSPREPLRVSESEGEHGFLVSGRSRDANSVSPRESNCAERHARRVINFGWLSFPSPQSPRKVSGCARSRPRATPRPGWRCWVPSLTRPCRSDRGPATHVILHSGLHQRRCRISRRRRPFTRSIRCPLGARAPWSGEVLSTTMNKCSSSPATN